MILFTFFAMIIIGASFGYFQRFVGGDMLDLVISGQDAHTRLSEMDDAQKQAHTWITLILDSLYPIAYGSFFAGATIWLAGKSKIWMATPALVTVIADFCENTVQLLALNGFDNLIVAKSVLTPIKFSAFFVMGLFFLFYLLTAIAHKIKNNSNRIDD